MTDLRNVVALTRLLRERAGLLIGGLVTSDDEVSRWVRDTAAAVLSQLHPAENVWPALLDRMPAHPEMRQDESTVYWDMARSSTMFHPGDLVDQVYPVSALQSARRGDLFAYLFRRFGYPRWGWDDRKSLVDYTLTTPDPEIVLWISPAGSARASFGYGLSTTLSDQALDTMQEIRTSDVPDGDWWLVWTAHPLYQRIAQAYQAGLVELARPVMIRDTPIWILGHASEANHPFRRFDDDGCWAWACADRSPESGIGLGEYDVVTAAQDEPEESPQSPGVVLATLGGLGQVDLGEAP